MCPPLESSPQVSLSKALRRKMPRPPRLRLQASGGLAAAAAEIVIRISRSHDAPSQGRAFPAREPNAPPSEHSGDADPSGIVVASLTPRSIRFRDCCANAALPKFKIQQTEIA